MKVRAVAGRFVVGVRDLAPTYQSVYTHKILYPPQYFIPRPRVKLKKQSNYNVNVNPLYRSVETANPHFTRTTVFIQTFSKGSFSIKRKLRGSLPVSLRINLGFKKKVPYRYLFQEFSKGVFLSGILMM